MDRVRLLILAIVVAIATTIFGGISPALGADQPAGPANPAAQEALAKQKAAADAVRARQLRDEAWQRRKAMRDFAEQVRQGQRPGPGAEAPNNPGGGK